MKTKTLSYLRVSGKGQIDGEGFPRQRESVTNYARRNRMEIVNEFRDEGVTGTLFDRPGLTELFLALKAGDAKVVLVEKADRLARDLIVSETLLAEFRKLGVKVVAAEGRTDLTVDNDDPSRKMIRQILGVVSEWEKSCIVQKLRAARIRSKEKNGRCEGQKPYGEKDGESEIVARIYGRVQCPPLCPSILQTVCRLSRQVVKKENDAQDCAPNEENVSQSFQTESPPWVRVVIVLKAVEVHKQADSNERQTKKEGR